MKRVGNLWPVLTSFANLLAAADAGRVVAQSEAGPHRSPTYCAKASTGTNIGCLCLQSAFGHCSTGPAFSHFSTIYGPPRFERR
ncbi:MAG: hypothetical protein ABSG65_14115 [Bryobacteraceae bacterium]